MYTYKTVPAPMNLSIAHENEVAKAISSFGQLINQECVGGWEFYSMETITVTTNPGCFSFKKPESITYNMLVFRKRNA